MTTYVIDDTIFISEPIPDQEEVNDPYSGLPDHPDMLLQWEEDFRYHQRRARWLYKNRHEILERNWERQG